MALSTLVRRKEKYLRVQDQTKSICNYRILVDENDTAYRQHLFNVAEGQGEAEVQPNGMVDDLNREAMTMVRKHEGAYH